MGSINLKHTGSGSAIALSSDGTNLLLNGTAIGGGGGGGSSPDLFDENYDGTSTKPSATGTNAITTGRQATATGTDAFGHGVNADASGQYSVSFGVNSEATGQSAMAMGRDSVATGNLSFAGPNSRANSDNSTALSITNNGTSYGAGGARSIAIGKQAKTDSATWDNVAIGKNAISNVSGGVSIAGAGLPVKISDVYSLPTADGSANQVMTTDGSGTVSWATPSGGGGSSPDLFAENYDGTSTAPSATGTNAVAIGVGASATTTGSFAVLGSASNGEYGIVMGINSTGVGNMPVAIGSSASARTRTISIGQSTTSNGTGSVAIGANVFADPSSGDGAVGLGNWAYAKGASSFANSFSRAGGASSIALGITSQSSTYGASGANSIALGQLSKATQANSIAIGDGAISTTANQIALGGATDTVKISNTYTLPIADGTNGQVLTTNGSGVSSWATPSGGGGGGGPTFKTFGTSSIMVGDDATGTISSANYNTGLGVDVFASLTSGDNNVAVGYDSLSNLGDGHENTAVGVSSLADASTGSKNVALGYFSCNSITTGSENVAVGWASLLSNTQGNNNVAVGESALRSNTASGNVGVGHDALRNNTTGLNNNALGKEALIATTTGSNNIGIGYKAGDAITTGSQNIMIGTYCDGGSSGTARIAIGYDMTVNSDNRVQIGSGNTNQIYNNFASNASWTRPSDERLKEDIQTNTSCGLDFINQLRTVTYKWKDKSAYDKKMYGLIAQEVKSSLDTNSITDFGGWSLTDEDDATSTQSIAYEMFVIPLIKSVQELKAKNDALEARITALEA
jgi:hypothetical protein